MDEDLLVELLEIYKEKYKYEVEANKAIIDAVKTDEDKAMLDELYSVVKPEGKLEVYAAVMDFIAQHTQKYI